MPNIAALDLNMGAGTEIMLDMYLIPYHGSHSFQISLLVDLKLTAMLSI